MQRRAFLKSATLAAGAALAGTTITATAARAADAPATVEHVYEVRTYHFASPEKQKAFADFLASTMIPALNRAGVKPVGVFTLTAKDNPDLKLDGDPNELWVFLKHPSPAALIDLENRLAADAEFQSAGKSILTAPKSDPAFTRISSMLLRPMSGSPEVRVPERSANRFFELRTYESPTVERHLNKLAMFNAGEFGAFERAGMPGVFFGGAIVAADLPQLTYMVVHDDEAHVKAQWSAFGKDEQWVKLKNDPQYKDNVSKITRRFLRPAAGSQI